MDPRQQEIVRLTRLLLPTYVLLCLLLFLPVGLRGVGVDLPNRTQSAISVPVMLGMVGALGWWWMKMTALGQWKPSGGPRFSLAAAILEGRYVGEAAPPPPRAPETPLAWLARDVGSLRERLAAHPRLDEALQGGLTKAEEVAGRLVVADRTAPPPAVARARAAVGRFEDHVVQLGKLLGAAGDPGAEWEVTLAADVTELTAALGELTAAR